MASSIFCIGLLVTLSKMSLMVYARPALDLPQNDYDYQQKDNDYGDLDQVEVVEEVTECIDYKSSAGIYKVYSEAPRPTPCGLYLVAPVDHQIELVFLDFDVDCQSNGLVEVVDGYAYGNGVFPPQEDSGSSSRHKRHCGAQKPSSLFRSSANAVVIQNRLSKEHQGFIVQVIFVRNPQPCNAVVLGGEGVVALSNYGLAHNCSLLMLFPQRVSVNFNYETKGATLPTKQYSNQGRADFMEILGGNSSSIDKMVSFEKSTGISSEAKIRRKVLCENVVVRLISSGRFTSSAVIHHETLASKDLPNLPQSQCHL